MPYPQRVGIGHMYSYRRISCHNIVVGSISRQKVAIVTLIGFMTEDRTAYVASFEFRCAAALHMQMHMRCAAELRSCQFDFDIFDL